MTPELKAKWIAALRSGEYQQGRGRLRTDDNRFCCLGVLCAVTGREFIEADSTTGYQQLIEATELPYRVSNKCIDMNDISRCSFMEIADYIESHL